MRVSIRDDISKLPADHDAITDLHFYLELTRFATPEPPKVIYACKNLRRLHLQSYGIERIDAGIAALTELRELVIDGPWSGRVRSIADEIGELRRLEVLQLDSENLEVMPEAILGLQELRVLKWKAWKLKAVPDLTKLPHLHTLWIDVATCGVPELLRELPALRDLRLWNAGKRVPSWLWSLDPLEAIGLDNLDKDARVELDKMPNLRRVWLQRNKRALPEGVGSLPKLTHLELRDELMPEIPAALLREGSPLEVLRVVDTKLRDLPATIARCRALRELSVANNVLKALPAEVATLGALETLEVHENMIPALPRDIGNLVKLRKLDAHKNKIEEVPASIGALTNLEELDLSANRIPSLPKSFFALSRLRSLSLANNLLPTVPAELAKLGALEKLLLQNNPATKGSKNKAADALLEGLAAQRTSGKGGELTATESDVPIALRARLQVADLDGARSLVTGEDGAQQLMALLGDRDANVRARALGILGEVLPDPFAHSIEGRAVVFVGQSKTVKKATLAPLLKAAGATWGDATDTGRIVVVGEKPGAFALARGDQLAALSQLEAWIVRAKRPHLMAPKAAAETSAQLGELLTSRANENVILGLKLAEDGGVPPAMLPVVLAIGRAHDDAKIRKSANAVFERYAPANLKLAVQNALGRVALTEGRDEKPVKAYAALAKVEGFDVATLAVEVARLSGLGVAYLLAQGPDVRERALRALVRDGKLAFTYREKIGTLPDEITVLADSLRSLVLQHCDIEALPASIATLRLLEELVLDFGLREVPPVLAKLPALRRLHLGAQRIQTLEGLGSLVSLEALHVESVRASMPEEIGRLVHLRQLTWRDYRDNMRDLSPALSKLGLLRELDLGGGDLSSVPQEVEPLLPQLTKLVIRLPKDKAAELTARYPNLVVTSR